jgi:hypothetical protein
MRISQSLTLIACILAAGTIGSSANAGTLTYNGYGFTGENVHVSDAALGINNEYGGAGLITLNAPVPFQAYCVDIADWLLSAGTYTNGIDPTSDPNLPGTSSITGDSKLADIGALIGNGTDVAAVQLAIWETEYGSAAIFTPDDPGLQAVASLYLANAEDGLWTAPAGSALYLLVGADGRPNQTLIYDPVPEPNTVAVLGSAIFLLGCAGRRRRRTG